MKYRIFFIVGIIILYIVIGLMAYIAIRPVLEKIEARQQGGFKI